jgi:glucokinase
VRVIKKRLGIDIGGTYIKYAILDESDRLIETREIKTQGLGKTFIKFLKIELAAILRKEPGIESIGIGIPGTVDPIEGTIIDSPALGLHNINFIKELKTVFSQSVHVENDVNAWTMAEKEMGAARKNQSFVMITIGTGIGAGICYKGEIIRGMDHQAGEVGYFPIGLGAYHAEVTNVEFGHFEQLASASGVSRRYHEKTNQSLSTRVIFEKAQAGDSQAMEIVNETLDYLALGISNIVCLLQPEKIVLGGGMMNAGPWMIEALTERVKKLIPMRFELVLSTVGKWGGAIGAAFIQ